MILRYNARALADWDGVPMTTVAIALAGLALAVCLVDLLLTVAVIRRLREHTDLISKFSAPGAVAMLTQGQTTKPFEAVATTGETVSRDTLSGLTLVGAFTPQCSACTERLPRFVEYAGQFPGGREQVIAVVMGDEAAAQEYRTALEPVAKVVIEAGPGGVVEALAVASFPAFGVLDSSGVVVTSALDLDDLSVPAGV